jgi:hypothetical protein
MFLKTEIKAAPSDMMHEPMQANFPISLRLLGPLRSHPHSDYKISCCLACYFPLVGRQSSSSKARNVRHEKHNSDAAGAATNAEVESQANIGINDWINATSDAYYGYFSIAKIEYKTGLGYEEDLQSETGSSLLARELWSGLFNPLQPIIESWVLDERPAPSSLQSYMSSSEYEIAVNDAGM